LIADGKLEKLQELDKIREEKQKVEQEFQNFVKANKDDPSVGRLLNKYLKDPESLTIGEMERAKSTGIIEQVERGKRLNQLNKLQRTLESSDEVKKETKQVEEAAQKKQDQMAKTLEGAKKIPVTTWVANSAGTGAPGVPIKDEIWVSSTGVPLTPEEVQLKELLEKNQQNSLLPPMTSNQKAEKDQMAIKLENSPKPSTTGPVIIDNSTKNNMVTPGKPSASLLVAPSFTKDFQLSLYQRPSYV
jgi:hypothetical protein